MDNTALVNKIDDILNAMDELNASYANIQKTISKENTSLAEISKKHHGPISCDLTERYLLEIKSEYYKTERRIVLSSLNTLKNEINDTNE